MHVFLISCKVIQIHNSAVSGEMLQVTFSFQNYVEVTFVRHFFKFQVCTTNVRINYFILYKSLNSPNLYINWANMWYPDYHNKKLSSYMLNSFKGFQLCINWGIMWYPENQLRKKLDLCMLLQANKSILCRNQIRIQNMY